MMLIDVLMFAVAHFHLVTGISCWLLMQGYNVECSQEMIVHERDERDEEEENVFILSDKS